MRECLIEFFKKNKGLSEVLIKDIRKFYFDYNDFDTTNPNQYYLFKSQLDCFLKKGKHKRVKIIDWDVVNKKLFKNKVN